MSQDSAIRQDVNIRIRHRGRIIRWIRKVNQRLERQRVLRRIQDTQAADLGREMGEAALAAVFAFTFAGADRC